MPYYTPKRLPHWDPGNYPLFITWRLHGSLPQRESDHEKLTPGQRFVHADRALDRMVEGPHWLKVPEVADCVMNTLLYAERTLKLYDLHAWVIMSNHVHILIDPFAPLAKITRTLKGYSAHEANAILGRTGQPFWQSESYDHVARSQKEFDNIADYIESNPVNAGLVDSPEDWRWSSVSSVGLEAHTTKTGTAALTQADYEETEAKADSTI